jgi:hypothetical protein
VDLQVERKIKSDVELFTAALHQWKVKVIQLDKTTGEEWLYEEGATIEKFDTHCVKIGGVYYFRNVCLIIA